MIAITHTPKRYRSSTAVDLAPVLLVAAWGVAWIAFHASQQVGAHTLFQTLALAESVTALLLRRRKPEAVKDSVGEVRAQQRPESDPGFRSTQRRTTGSSA